MQSGLLNACICTEVLTLTQTSPVCNTSLLETLWEKEKLLVTSNFSFSLRVFYPFLPIWTTFCHFHQIQNCCLQTLSVWKSLEFVVWERVNNLVQDLYHYFNDRLSLNDSQRISFQFYHKNTEFSISVKIFFPLQIIPSPLWKMVKFIERHFKYILKLFLVQMDLKDKE